ncbi:hypothetical protein C8Q80DRAFT_1265985 [Daedaleopsis nitida]|nr:hypothetical protein C8Q80DRAFT_1265985 [Daedaleopsis nitida]
MSSANDFAYLIDLSEIFRSTNQVKVAAITFFAYDLAITFDREIQFFWKRKFSIPSALLVATRYWYLLVCVTYILQIALHSNEGYHIHIYAASIMNIIVEYTLYIPFAVFSGMRAYALCKSWIISGVITLLSLAPVCVNFIKFGMFYTLELFPVLGCGFSDFSTLQDTIMELCVTMLLDTVVSRGSLIIADCLLIFLTWRTLGAGSIRERFSGHSTPTTFTSILLWNGTLYFLAITTLNILHLIFTINSIFSDGTDFGPSQLTGFTDPLTTILVYRFMIALQEANEHNVKIGSADAELRSFTYSQGSLNFINRAIGSFGSVIAPGVAAMDDEYGEETLAHSNEDHQLSGSRPSIELGDASEDQTGSSDHKEEAWH